MNRPATTTKRNQLAWEFVDALHLGVIVFDLDGRIGEINDAAARHLRIDRDSSLGRPARSVLAPDSVVLAVIEATIRDMRSVPEMIGPPLGPDVPGTVRCRSRLLRRSDGEERAAVCHFEDMTVLRNMERQVNQLDRLATVGRFASGIAHEIRNPLMGIYAGVQYLEKTLSPDTPEQTTTFRIICEEVERLNRIVEDLLGAAKPPEPRYGDCDPNDIAAKAASLAEQHARERSVRVRLETDNTLPPAHMDSDQVIQVLLNLLRNAIEASPDRGSVAFSTNLSTGSPTGGFLPDDCGPGVEFRVRDEGPGVPEDVQETIFEPFHTSKHSGTGLGLYISFQIVEKHGGALWVESVPGHGAEFIARFPYRSTRGTSRMEHER